MAITIPTLALDSGLTVENAYGYQAFIALDVPSGAGRMVLNAHPAEEHWQRPPLKQFELVLGQVVVPADPAADPPVEEVRVATLAELMADPQFAAAYALVGARLYQEWLKLPALKGAQVS